MWWSPFCFGPFSRVLSKKFIYRSDFSWRLETSDFSCIVFQHSPHVWRTHFAEYLYFPDQALSEILPWFYVSCSTLSYSNTTSLQVFLEFVSKNWLSSQALNNFDYRFYLQNCWALKKYLTKDCNLNLLEGSTVVNKW